MNKKYDDGLEWLRELRLRIAAECGNDIHAINERYCAAAACVPHRSYGGASITKRVRRKIPAHS